MKNSKKLLVALLAVGLVFGVAVISGVKNVEETANVKLAYDPPVGG